MKLFPSLHIEGGLLSPDLPEKILAGNVPGQKPQDFGLGKGRNLTDEIAAKMNDARKLWRAFQRRRERLPEDDWGTSLTRDFWVIPLLALLDYELHPNAQSHEVDGQRFKISHRAGENLEAPPVHIVSFRQELGKRHRSSAMGPLSPHALLQEFLNRTEHLWGIVTNGLQLRLLRDSTYVRRQSFVEFDLKTIFDEDRFEDFALLYRLLHRTRLPQPPKRPEECLLEYYHKTSLELGGRVRERLRDGVEECIKKLANGFLTHPRNHTLRQRIAASQELATEAPANEPAVTPQAVSPLSPQELYSQVLRLVYRFLFLLVSEDRGLLSNSELYREHYSVSRLRRLADDQRAYDQHDDLWQSLRVLWKLLGDDKPQPQVENKPLASLLDLPVLDGHLFESLDLDGCSITNANLLEALRELFYYQDEETKARQRVNYAALDVEELGSVYESLLDYHPVLEPSGEQQAAGKLRFELAFGSERKSTGSYYTPPELVADLVRSALEPVMEERLKVARAPEERERAILSMRVLDPACGSGHFLLAAARRLGKELARVRTGEDEPAPESVREAIRDVIAHCIYGVDKNPLAVELCRVALWLEAHCGGKPLTFLDHHIKCGDSLVGVVDLKVLEQGIPDEAFAPHSGDDKQIAKELRKRNRREREDLASGQLSLQFRSEDALLFLSEKAKQLEDVPDDDLGQVRRKAELYSKQQHDPQRCTMEEACHLWTAAFFQGYTPEAKERGALITTQTVSQRLEDNPQPQALARAWELASSNRFFHWPLEFPEVFAASEQRAASGESHEPLGAGRSQLGDPAARQPGAPAVAASRGFDVVIGNPPFLGGLKISGTFGDKYRRWLEVAYEPYSGTADLCAAFFRRAYSLLRPGGRMGMVATNTIGQGDTRESGLAIVLRQGGAITFAQRFKEWPGAANVEVNLVAIQKRAASGEQRAVSPILDGKSVPFISSRLDAEPEAEPVRLRRNEGKAFMGDKRAWYRLCAGTGGSRSAYYQRSAQRRLPLPLFERRGPQQPSRAEAQPLRDLLPRLGPGAGKAQYPDLLRIVEERVKPERESPTRSRRQAQPRILVAVRGLPLRDAPRHRPPAPGAGAGRSKPISHPVLCAKRICFFAYAGRLRLRRRLPLRPAAIDSS
jgi:hypothetical protein